MIVRIIQTWFTWIMLALAFTFAYFNSPPFSSALLAWLLFFMTGIVSLWAALGHLMQPEKTAANIGWLSSPFQREMGFTNLAMGIAGVIAPWQPMPYQLCLIIVFSILWWGCAYGHVKEAIEKHNFAVHNTGPMLYTTILVPPLLWGLYLLSQGL